MSGAFAKVPVEVLETGNGYAIAVYAAIARHATRSGGAYPSLARLQQTTGWSRPTVDKAIRTLCEAGLLVKTQRRAGGMKQSNSYELPLHARSRLEATVGEETPEPQMETSLPSSETTFTTMETSLPHDGNVVTSGTKRGYHEQEPIEPEPINKSNGATRSNLVRIDHPAKPTTTRQPLPQNGVAQQIVAAYCDAVGIDAPVSYPKAVGQAKVLANANIRPDDIADMVQWLRGQRWTAGAIDLGLIVNQADKWRAAQRSESTTQYAYNDPRNPRGMVG